MTLTPADIDAIASAVVAKLKGAEVDFQLDPPIPPAELARRVAAQGKSVLKDFNRGSR